MRNTLSLLSLVTMAIAAPLASFLASAQTAAAQDTPIQPATSSIANSGSITAKVSALRNQTGQVCFSLFDSSKGFPNNSEAIVETKCISASSVDTSDRDVAEADTADAPASLSVTFEALPIGTYAATAFHDENEDGDINQGNFGIPLEGFGFSQNPPVTTRAPEFSETAIIVVGAQTTTEIELIYY